MTKNINTFLAIFISIFISISNGQDPPDNSDLIRTIGSFYDAIEMGDAEARIRLLAEDVILMPNHWTMMRGKEAVSESFRRGATAVFKIRDLTIVKKEVSGNMAYTVNSYYYTYHGKGEADQWHKTKNVHIWKKDLSGDWKLAVDIWNSDVPMDQFLKE